MRVKYVGISLADFRFSGTTVVTKDCFIICPSGITISSIVCWIRFFDKLSRPTVHLCRAFTTLLISFISVSCKNKFITNIYFKCERNEAVGEGINSITVLPILAKPVLNSSVIMV